MKLINFTHSNSAFEVQLPVSFLINEGAKGLKKVSSNESFHKSILSNQYDVHNIIKAKLTFSQIMMYTIPVHLHVK